MIQKTPKRRRIVKRLLLILLMLPLIVVGVYMGYIYLNYHRLPDAWEVHSQSTANKAALHVEYTAVTWNIESGICDRDYSSFFEGGDSARASSPEAVKGNLEAIARTLRDEHPDHILLQSVDMKADRSFNINEVEALRSSLGEYQSYFARNCNLPYIVFPIKNPYGAAQSGLVSFSNRDIYRAERHRIPVREDLRKVLDLDRCYTVCRIPTADGRQLCLYNLHLSGALAGSEIADSQLQALFEDMLFEYRKGHYCVAGGDFGGDLQGHSDRLFGIAAPEFTGILQRLQTLTGFQMNQSVNRRLIPEGLQIVESQDKKNPLPSVRALNGKYIPGETYVQLEDGFIVSDNVQVTDCHVIDLGFEASSHNPVKITFQLVEETETSRYELGPYTALPGV